MKGFFFLLILMVSVGSFSQDKINVKYKKGLIYVNKVAWAKYEYAAGKTFISTIAGVEFVSMKQFEYGSGNYDRYTGAEYMNYYYEVHFFKSDIVAFEVDAGSSEIYYLMEKLKVLENDNFNLANAIEFKNRYAGNVSEKVFLTK
jgi:hypothetical protein